MKMKIIFSRPRKFTVAGFLIRLVESRPYCHVLLEIVDHRTGQHMVYEESHGEAHYMLKSNWLTINREIAAYETEIKESQLKTLIVMMNDFCQAPYAYSGILGIAFSLLTKIPFNIFGNGSKSMVCSEFIGLVLRIIYGYSFKKDIELLGPRDIYKKIESVEAFIKIK